MTPLQPIVHPFSDPPVCPKCGSETNPALGVYAAPFNVRYCPGGKELEEEKHEHEPMVRAMSVLAKMVPGLPASAASPIICAGVLTEHLHKTCGRCGFELLTECKGEA